MQPTKVTKPIKKLLATRSSGVISKVFDLCDRNIAKEEYEEIHEVEYWLVAFEEEGHSTVYTLDSKPAKFSRGYRGFNDLEEACEYFAYYIA